MVKVPIGMPTTFSRNAAQGHHAGFRMGLSRWDAAGIPGYVRCADKHAQQCSGNHAARAVGGGLDSA